MGRAKKQQVAATSTASVEEVVDPTPAVASVSASITTQELIAQMAEQQKKLQEEIAALRVSF
ncbi:hypothetical protein DENSPDRAFT_845960 [Dentipellis sp. KUC8613]|nr:hypothetical protein DENSPDRAFT_845960 [Dentipellis sp. KUC8613]